MNTKWRKVAFDILKYAVGAIFGALGLSLTGCSSVPMFIF